MNRPQRPTLRAGFRILLCSAAAALLASCVGVSSDATIGADGSGSVVLRYRVSGMVETMGKLESNQRYLPLPVSRQDFENILAGHPGLSLQSWSDRKTEDDLSVEASVSFATLEDLVTLLDASGRSAKLQREGGRTTLALTLAEGGAPLDPDLKSLVETAFQGYDISLRFSLPVAPKSNVNGSGSGNVVSYSAPVATLLEAEKPLVWTFSW